MINSGPCRFNHHAGLNHKGDDDHGGYCHSRWHSDATEFWSGVVGQKYRSFDNDLSLPKQGFQQCPWYGRVTAWPPCAGLMESSRVSRFHPFQLAFFLTKYSRCVTSVADAPCSTPLLAHGILRAPNPQFSPCLEHRTS